MTARQARGRCRCGALVGDPTKPQLRADGLQLAGWQRLSPNCWKRVGEPQNMYGLTAAFRTEFGNATEAEALARFGVT